MSYLDDIDYSTLEAGDLYDELPLWSAPFGLMLLDRVPVRAGLTILDVGCGTGFVAIELAQRCGSTSRVIAVDPWTTAVARLRRKIAYLGLNNLQVFETDASNTGLGDSTVDLLVSNLGIHNFDKPLDVLHECARIAKPGASLCITTNLAGHMAEFYDIYRATLGELGFNTQALDAHIGRRGTVDGISELLTSAGFEVIDSAVQHFRMRFASGTTLLRHYFVRLGFMEGWKAVVPRDAVEPFFRRLENNLNTFAVERGELALTIPMAYIESRRR